MMIFFSHIHSRMQESPMVTHRESPFTFLVSSRMVLNSPLNSMLNHSLLSLSQSYSSAPDGSNKKKSSTPKVKILRQVDQRQPKAQAHFQAMFNQFKAMKQVCGSLKVELAARLLAIKFKYERIFLFFKFLIVSYLFVLTGFSIYQMICDLFPALTQPSMIYYTSPMMAENGGNALPQVNEEVINPKIRTLGAGSLKHNSLFSSLLRLFGP